MAENMKENAQVKDQNVQNDNNMAPVEEKKSNWWSTTKKVIKVVAPFAIGAIAGYAIGKANSSKAAETDTRQQKPQQIKQNNGNGNYRPQQNRPSTTEAGGTSTMKQKPVGVEEVK